MIQTDYKIISNVKIADDTYKMKLAGDTSAFSKPGQFLNIKLDGFYLRRPISICDLGENELTIIYKVVGDGTRHMTSLEEELVLDCLVGLGNGYDLDASGNRPVLVGGGCGAPPLYYLCKKLVEQGNKPIVSLGFNSKDEVFLEDEFLKLTKDTYVYTVDGSYGDKGFPTDVFAKFDGEYDYVYTCGPEPMLKAVYNQSNTSGQFSFEERMGCGFGACMGCTCKTKYGDKRICKEGPVLVKEEIIW